MKQYVIGNDIDDISWDIYAKHEVPENFDDATEMIVYAQHYYTPAATIPAAVSISGNRMKLVFLAADMRKTGVYDIVLEYKKPELAFPGGVRNLRVTNCAAFEIVGKSCEVEVPEDPLLIEGIVAPLKGYSAYEVAVKNGFVGTEADWLESLKLHFDDLTEDELAVLQQPARDTIDDILAVKTAIEEEEEIRHTNELQRITNEQARADAENTRIANEQGRITNEQARINAETIRENNEVERRTNESVRQSNEVLREQLRSEIVTLKSETESARDGATQAAQSANTAASTANTAAQNANDKAGFAQTKGDYAKAQGDYAKAQGDYIASLEIITTTIVGETEYNEIFN